MKLYRAVQGIKKGKLTSDWSYVRDCGNDGEAWLAIFQKDEPEAVFILADKKPNAKPYKR